MNITAYTRVGDYGQEVCGFVIENDTLMSGFVLTENYNDLSGKALSRGILDTETTTLPKEKKIRVTLKVDPFLYRYPFTLSWSEKEQTVSVTKEDLTKVEVQGLEEFEAREASGVPYRLYTPAAEGKRALVLFLHGAGEVGTDNVLQMTGTIGALELAKRFPDLYVLAPQARGFSASVYDDAEERFSREYRFTPDPTLTPPSLKNERGWNRDYVGKVCDIIRSLIDEGKVDPDRVYVTGMSMGGAGTLQALSVAPDLFAAAIPICPTMCGEAYGQLLNLPRIPVWITASYIDHQPGRHAYIYRAVSKLWREGRTDVHYTMYTPEELAVYGIGTTPGLTTEELYAENHNCWIPTLRNDGGILNWMLSQRKIH